MTDSSQRVRLEHAGSVAIVTLNRPEALNALDSATLEAFREVVGEIAAAPAVRAVVVTGEGRAFAAGADISEMKLMTPAQASDFSRLGHEAFAALESLAAPTIAAVNGYALGGGCELACSCDWIYASSRARFGLEADHADIPAARIALFENQSERAGPVASLAEVQTLCAQWDTPQAESSDSTGNG